jgi:hypothetical protein
LVSAIWYCVAPDHHEKDGACTRGSGYAFQFDENESVGLQFHGHGLIEISARHTDGTEAQGLRTTVTAILDLAKPN